MTPSPPAGRSPDALRHAADDAWERGDWRQAAKLMRAAEKTEFAGRTRRQFERAQRAAAARALAPAALTREAIAQFAVATEGRLTAAQAAEACGVTRCVIIGIRFRAKRRGARAVVSAGHAVEAFR